MNFEALAFSKLNETDVREEIIAPLLRECGYRSGTNNNIIREQSLRYPRAFVGRKKGKKDPMLRGKADYICEVDSLIRWVVEAKDPSVDIGLDEIDQAYTYACHPEVRAVYFCITNGRKILFFQTEHGPESPPILEVEYQNLNNSIEVIKTLVSPDSLKRNFPRVEVDVGKPLGPGLRSVMRITNGSIIFEDNNLGLVTLKGMTITIVEGALERDEEGRIVSFLKTRSPYQSHQKLNEKLGLDKFEAISNDEFISTDRNKPTRFMSQQVMLLPAGEKVLDLQSWEEVALPINLTYDITTLAVGHLEHDYFSGTFKAILDCKEMKIKCEMTGSFEIHIA